MIIRMEDPGLSEKELQTAEILASNEINEIMADLEIMEEQLERSYLFQGLNLQEYAIEHLKKLPHNKDGTSFSNEVLSGVYQYYFGDAAKGNTECK